MSQVIINGQAYEQNPDGSLTPVKPASPGLGSIAQPVVNYGINKAIDAITGSSGAIAAAAPSAAAGVAGGAATSAASAAAAAEAAGSAGSAGAAAAAGEAAAGTSALGLIGGGIAAIHGGYGLVNNFGHLGHVGGAISGAETGAGIGTMIAPGVGTLIGGGIGALGGLALSAFDHKKVAQYEAEKLQSLAALKSPTINKFLGKNATLQDISNDKIPKSSPTDLWGSYGMFNTFGDDYLGKMSEAQRFAATQYAIDNGLLKSDHGDVSVTDPAKLKAALATFSANKDYLKAYQLWKKANPKEGVPSVTPGATPPVTGTTPATAKIDLSALMPKGDSRADKWNKVQSVLGQADPKSFQKLKVGSSLRGLMPENFGSY